MPRMYEECFLTWTEWDSWNPWSPFSNHVVSTMTMDWDSLLSTWHTTDKLVTDNVNTRMYVSHPLSFKINITLALKMGWINQRHKLGPNLQQDFQQYHSHLEHLQHDRIRSKTSILGFKGRIFTPQHPLQLAFHESWQSPSSGGGYHFEIFVHLLRGGW